MQRRDVEILPSSGLLPILSLVEIIPDASGWTPVIFANHNRFRLGNVTAGFRYRGRKDGAPENPLSGGMRDCVIDYDNIGNPKGNSGARGVYISNGGGQLRLERIRGVNMYFGYHIQNWRYADGGHPGGGITTVDCDCKGNPSDHLVPKWYPFGDQGDVSVEMPGDLIAPGQSAVIATPEERLTSYGAKRPARTRIWSNATRMPIRVPETLSAAALSAAGLARGGETARVHNKTTLGAAIHAYWTSGGRRKPDCVVKAETGRIDGADHDGGYYGTMLQGTREYFVSGYRSRNNVRGIAGQQGAHNVHLRDIAISRSTSSAILAGYNSTGWTIDDFTIEASNERWVGESLINIQLGAGGARIGRGRIAMGNDIKSGQYAVKFGPNSPGCRIDGPLEITGDCSRAYIAVESAMDKTLSARHPENYAQFDYSGLASLAMTGIRLRNITIQANSVKPRVPTAIAIIQASDGAPSQGYHGDIGISDLVIENVTITSDKHAAQLKLIQSAGPSNPDRRIRGVTMRNFRTPATVRRGNHMMDLPDGLEHFSQLSDVSGMPDLDRR
ncbi:MAG: hypothetical protein P8J20_14290 [Novosphingobium sp.]|nr:hypothetical protein [Novosphingobium sp.]